MSAHGISPTWFQVNDIPFDDPWVFNPIANLGLFLNCSFKVNENDVFADITTITLTCAFNINQNNILVPITVFDLDCSFQIDQSDILVPITNISLSCFTEIV